MQSLMQKMTAAAILFILLASAHADTTAAVPNPLKPELSPATIQFLKVYVAYAKTVRDHNVKGLKTFLAPNFLLGGEGQSFRGEAAFKELDACRIDQPGTLFSAAVHPLTVSETDAVALTQETYAFRMKVRNQNVACSVDYDWKQAWRKTPQGWKLAGMEYYKPDFDKALGISFRVLTQAKSEPAKAQAKPNVVK